MGINFISKVFGKQAPTSTTIAAEIDRSTKERDDIQRKIGAVHADLAGMSDDEHRAADERAAAMRRSVDRLNDGIAKLQKAHDDAIIVEESAQAAAKDEALQTRSEACRKSVNVEAKALLTEYDSLAEQMAAVISRVSEIEIEVTEVNKALRANRVAEDVQSVAQTWRTTAGTEGTEQRAKVPCWVYRYPGSPADTEETKYQYEAPSEDVRRATIGPDGKPVPGATEIHNYYGREIIIKPTMLSEVLCPDPPNLRAARALLVSAYQMRQAMLTLCPRFATASFATYQSATQFIGLRRPKT